MLCYFSDLFFVSRIHQGLFTFLAKWFRAIRQILSAENYYVASDISAFLLNHRATYRCDIARNATFDDHVPAKGEHALRTLLDDNVLAVREDFHFRSVFDGHNVVGRRNGDLGEGKHRPKKD